MPIMICLERFVIHIIHWIICYHRNAFLLFYEHALVILISYPSTLYFCTKSHLLWESYISMFYRLATDLLDCVCDCDLFCKRCFWMCICVLWIKDYLLTYLLTLFFSHRIPFWGLIWHSMAVCNFGDFSRCWLMFWFLSISYIEFLKFLNTCSSVLEK